MSQPRRRHARIAVTGGTGFVGRRVVNALRNAGWDAVACSRATGIDLRNGPAFGRWLRETGPDLVVHCAAHVGGIGYVGEHAIEVFHDNLAIGAGLMQGLRAAGVSSLVTVMPNCTYPGHKDVYREDEWWDGPIHESVLMYGLPRKTLWGLCKTYGDATGFHSAHLIFPNMYGPGDHFDPFRSHALGALIRKVCDAASEGRTAVELWGTGRPVREWMYIDDAAEALVAFVVCLERDDAPMKGHPIWNVGIEEGVSVLELAEMIRECVGWRGEFTLDASRPDGAMRKLLDGKQFARLTGWKPRHTLREGIEATVRWYRNKVQGELIHAGS